MSKQIKPRLESDDLSVKDILNNMIVALDTSNSEYYWQQFRFLMDKHEEFLSIER